MVHFAVCPLLYLLLNIAVIGNIYAASRIINLTVDGMPCLITKLFYSVYCDNQGHIYGAGSKIMICRSFTAVQESC